jgi:hypothetical protein
MTVIELNNGKRPCAHMKSFDAIQAAITSGQMPRINNNDHLPKTMMRFINTCLHMDASKRPSEEELLAACMCCPLIPVTNWVKQCRESCPRRDARRDARCDGNNDAVLS